MNNKQALIDIRAEANRFKGLVREHLPPGVKAALAYLELERSIQGLEDVIRDSADLERVFDKPTACDRRD